MHASLKSDTLYKGRHCLIWWDSTNASEDALGSVTEIAGKEGNVLRSYRYDSWGEMTRGDESGDANPYRYVGKYGVRWQDKTMGYYQMGVRHYHPNLGRFIQKDPISKILQTYAYARNNPILYNDATGLTVSSGGIKPTHDYLSSQYCPTVAYNYDFAYNSLLLKSQYDTECLEAIEQARFPSSLSSKSLYEAIWQANISFFSSNEGIMQPIDNNYDNGYKIWDTSHAMLGGNMIWLADLQFAGTPYAAEAVLFEELLHNMGIRDSEIKLNKCKLENACSIQNWYR